MQGKGEFILDVRGRRIGDQCLSQHCEGGLFLIVCAKGAAKL